MPGGPRSPRLPAGLHPARAGRPWKSLCFQCALPCLLFASQEPGSLNILLKKTKICNLVLVDELQAGLADGDIYLSVYLKEVWFKTVSLDLFIACVCVCVCGKGEHTSPTVPAVWSMQNVNSAARSSASVPSASRAQRKVKGWGRGVQVLPSSHPPPPPWIQGGLLPCLSQEACAP